MQPDIIAAQSNISWTNLFENGSISDPRTGIKIVNLSSFKAIAAYGNRHSNCLQWQEPTHRCFDLTLSRKVLVFSLNQHELAAAVPTLSPNGQFQIYSAINEIDGQPLPLDMTEPFSGQQGLQRVLEEMIQQHGGPGIRLSPSRQNKRPHYY